MFGEIKRKCGMYQAEPPTLFAVVFKIKLIA